MPTNVAFSDWRIRLGIVLGVLVFCFYAIVMKLATTEAWTTINFITLGCLGVGAYERKFDGQS